MRHGMESSSFGRRTDQRKALMRGLATSLLDKGRIQTTLIRAKELRKVVEPLITLGKRGDLHARRQAAAYLYSKTVVSKLFGEVADRFKDRPGGYTRIFKVQRRRGDGAKMALIELIPSENEAKKAAPKKASTKKAKTKKVDAQEETSKKEAKASAKPAKKKSTAKTKAVSKKSEA